jgi:LPS-assembly lipoprotein
MSLPDSARPCRRTALCVLAAGGLAGCGFKLRGPPALEFRSIALAGFAPRSPMALELQRNLAQTVKVLDAPAQAEVVLQALTDTRERSVVASTTAAQVREIQLRVALKFRAQTPSGRELLPPAELMLSRDLSYTETAALAKEQEETEMFRSMQSDVVAQVLRRLAAIRL